MVNRLYIEFLDTIGLIFVAAAYTIIYQILILPVELLSAYLGSFAYQVIREGQYERAGYTFSRNARPQILFMLRMVLTI